MFKISMKNIFFLFVAKIFDLTYVYYIIKRYKLLIYTQNANIRKNNFAPTIS